MVTTPSISDRVTWPDGYSWRLAAPADAELIQFHREAMFLDMGADVEKLRRAHAASLIWHRRSLDNGTYTGFLVEHGNPVVASAGVLWQDLPPSALSEGPVRAYILNVYVSPEHRGRALARHLVDVALQECRRRGVTVVTLHASGAGRPTYARLGFQPSEEMRLILTADDPS